MPCINAKGEISDMARQILTVMLQPVPLSQVAAAVNLPLYLIRSAARELAQAALAAEADDLWEITDGGRKALEKTLAHA